MKIVIQRVSEASVTIDKKVYNQIGKGLLLFVGIEETDCDTEIIWLANKVVNMRLFDDDNGLTNLSVKDIGGEILLISQFTLMANTHKGNRPSYINAAKPNIALPKYENLIIEIEKVLNKKIVTGLFGADMKVYLINDGPITILLNSKEKEL